MEESKVTQSANHVNPSVWVMLGGLFWTFGQLFYQIYEYLKNGWWPNWSTLIQVREVLGTNNWLFNPSSWFGLQKVVFALLDMTTPGIILFVVGIAMVHLEKTEES